MFTGIVEEQGRIISIEPTQKNAADDSVEALRVRIEAPLAVSDTEHGASISVSGVCLTVVEFDEKSFAADVMAQTLKLTSLGTKSVDSAVNIERAMAASDRFGGHIVQGHVDTTAEVLAVEDTEQWRIIRFSLADDWAPLLVAQGSVAVDGVSLTVANVSSADAGAGQHWFEVSLIPETLAATTLGELQVGNTVNVETDILARHLARLEQFSSVNNPSVKGDEN